jgi:rhamnosyltransferase
MRVTPESSLPRVLVLLAVRNGLPWIQDQIDSILSQQGVVVSLVVSDDASTDGTFEYCTQRHGVDLLAGRGPHGSAGRNFFHLLSQVDVAGQDYVAFADADDIWYPWKLSRAVQELQRTGSDGYGANVTAFWENGREKLIDKAHQQREWDFLFESAGPGCTFVFSRRLAASVQQVLRLTPSIPDEVSQHDWFVYAWARSHGFRWTIDIEPVMRYRQHAGNELGVNTGSRAAERRFKQLKSGWYRRQVEAITSFCDMHSQPFIRTVLGRSWKSRLTLALRVRNCRRRNRDRFVLAVASVLGWF